jgi:hypothetical protein
MTSLFDREDKSTTLQEGYGLAELALSNRPESIPTSIMSSNRNVKTGRRKKVQKGSGMLKKIVKIRKQTGKGVSRKQSVKVRGSQKKRIIKQKGRGIRKAKRKSVYNKKKITQLGRGVKSRRKTKLIDKRKINF